MSRFIYLLYRQFFFCFYEMDRYVCHNLYLITVLVYFITPPPLELKTPKPVWKFFENPRISFGFRDFTRQNCVCSSALKIPHSNSNHLNPSQNFFLSSRGRGIKVGENGNISKKAEKSSALIIVFLTKKNLNSTLKLCSIS